MHTVENLKQQLSQLGLGWGGGPPMVHASMRRVGPVEGGAAGLLDALFDCLGPDGTALMILATDDGIPFDAATTPADPEIGVLAEFFRTPRHAYQRQSGGTFRRQRSYQHGAARALSAAQLLRSRLSPVAICSNAGPSSAAWQ